jgi:iron(III) transport system ATP-binding protein
MATVTLAHVTKRFGGVTAVSDLNLEIQDGECFSLLGPSGCGKTTTLRMLAGFEDLDEGEIRVGDRVFSSSATRFYLPPEQRDFGMVFQAFAVWPHLDIFDNVAFPLQIKGLGRVEIQARTRRALEDTGLLKVQHAFPGELSGGEKQRIALARAIAINPQVLLLDEPLSNLDPKLREEMRFEIKDLQRRLGFTIVFVTHDQAEAMAISDRMLVMRDGVLQQVGPPIDIYERPASRFVFSFIGLSNFLPVTTREGRIFVQGATEAGPVAGHTPEATAGSAWTLACRPTAIDLVAEGGLRGVVARRVYLGDTVDYRIRVGPHEVRVQKGARHEVFEEGATVGLHIRHFLGYPPEPEA